MKRAVWTVGRFNPPTIGHGELIQSMTEHARRQNSYMFVFVTRSHDNKTNPLDPDSKMEFLKDSFPGVPFTSVSGIMEAFAILEGGGFSHATGIFGSDRANQFQNMTNGLLADGHITIDCDFKVLQRDPESESVTGVSSTLARKYAFENDYENFARITPVNMHDTNKRQMFQIIKDTLNDNRV